MRTYTYKEFGLDLLIGFIIALMGVPLITALSHLPLAASTLIAFVTTVFFAASAVRSRRWGRIFLHGLGIGLGASTVILGAAVVFQRNELPLYALGALLLVGVCVIGAFCRRLCDLGGIVPAALLLLCTTAIGFVGWKYGVPKLLSLVRAKHVNFPSPDFTLTRMDGSSVTLNSLRGKVVILDLWATWCAPRKMEMPSLLRVYRLFENNPNVVYLAVNVGWEGDDDAKVRGFLAKNNWPFPTTIDHAQAAQKLHVTFVPEQIVIDRSGRIRLINSGYFNNPMELQNRLTDEVNGLLKQ